MAVPHQIGVELLLGNAVLQEDGLAQFLFIGFTAVLVLIRLDDRLGLMDIDQ